MTCNRQSFRFKLEKGKLLDLYIFSDHVQYSIYRVIVNDTLDKIDAVYHNNFQYRIMRLKEKGEIEGSYFDCTVALSSVAYLENLWYFHRGQSRKRVLMCDVIDTLLQREGLHQQPTALLLLNASSPELHPTRLMHSLILNLEKM